MNFTMGSWLVMPERNTVISGDRPHHVSPRSMELLVYLAQRQGRVIGKEELLQEVWKGAFVSDDALTRCVGELRRAFHDGAHQAAILQTVPKRGYMLVPLVTWRPNDPPISNGPAHDSTNEQPVPSAPVAPAVLRARRYLVVIVGLTIVFSLVAGFVFFYPRPPLPLTIHASVHRLAVLPLTNLTGDPQLEYFSDGMTEELITELSQLSAWEVISRTSSMRYKRSTKSLRQVAAELSADWIMEGTVQRAGTHVRLTAQLIDAVSDVHLWSGSFESDMTDVLKLESRLAREVAGAVELRISLPEEARLAHTRTVVPAAYDDYLMGWYLFDHGRFGEAASNFENATIKDPGFALAYALLWEADAMEGFADDRPLTPRALSAVSRAVELDSNLSEAHAALGDLEFAGRWNWHAGEAQYRRAIELDPKSVDSAFHYATCLSALARWNEAVAAFRMALRLDPFSPTLNAMLLATLVNAHRYDEAEARYRNVIRLQPDNAGMHRAAGEMYQNSGRDAEAAAAFLRADALSASPGDLAVLRHAASVAGLKGYWKERLNLLQIRNRQSRVAPFLFAYVYVHLRDNDHAMRMLQRAYDQHSARIIWIRASACWDPLRSDPRFQRLLANMHFPG